MTRDVRTQQILVAGDNADDVEPIRGVLDREFKAIEVSTHPDRDVADFDRVKPKVASVMFVTNVNPYLAQLINKWRKGNLLIAGRSLYVLEVSPAAYVSLAANEAEKAADISIIEVRAVGRFGRLFISGTESDVQAAAAAARAVIEQMEGRA